MKARVDWFKVYVYAAAIVMGALLIAEAGLILLGK